MPFRKTQLMIFVGAILGLYGKNALAQDDQFPRQSTSTAQPSWQADADGCKVWNPAPVSNETVIWSGECVNGFANGYGTEAWFENGKAGNTITGTMVNGRFSGKVTVRYPDGSIYKGRLQSNGGGPDGDGYFTSKRGRVYRVSYTNGRRTWLFPESPSANETKCSNLGFDYVSNEFSQCLRRLEQIDQQREKLVYVTTDKNGSDFYYDANSIRTSESEVYVWLTIDAKKDKTVKFRTSKQRVIYDCDRDNSKLIQYVVYNAAGGVIDRGNFDQFELEWQGIIPGSIGSAVYMSVCAQR